MDDTLRQGFNVIMRSVLIVFLSLINATFAAANSDYTNKTRISENYGKIPLQFEANQGQTDEQVKFLSRGKGYSVYLTSKEAVLVLTKNKKGHDKADMVDAGKPADINDGMDNPEELKSAVIRMKLVDAAEESSATGLDELPGKVNYFIGSDPSKWHTNVSTYKKAQFKDVYQGIDLVYYGTNQRQLEYDFVIAPGADPKKIMLDFEGADKLEVDAEGNLVVSLPGGTESEGGQVIFHKPFIYQEVDGMKEEIYGRYIVRDNLKVGFQIGAYDTTKHLIIDPVLVYSTYLGGSDWDYGRSIAVDAFGNAYVTGRTGAGFPTVNAFQTPQLWTDTFISKLTPDGSALVYSTYLGGNDSDYGSDIAVDETGNAYVTGATWSTDFPTINPFQATNRGRSDIFVAKLNPTGSKLVYSTYLGGSYDDGLQGGSLAIDGVGNAYVTGYTASRDFPTANPFQATYRGGSDVFVAKLDTTGSELVYSTYLGGSSPEGFGYFPHIGIAADSFGNACVTGFTSSADFPTINPLQATYSGNHDVFATKFNPSGSVIYSTYLGGSKADYGHSVAADEAGNCYITGVTTSNNFPVANAFQEVLHGGSDAFVTKLNPDGSAIVYSTYLGGSSIENSQSGGGIAVDTHGNAYVTGITNSVDFPIVDAFQEVLRGAYDVFVTKLNSAGTEIIYSTYLGGSGDENYLWYGHTWFRCGIAVDAYGNAYVSGSTTSIDFPTKDAFQTNKQGSMDVFIAKISDGVTLSPPFTLSAIDTPCDNGGSIGLSWTLSPDDSTLSSGSKQVTGYTVYRSGTSGGPYAAIATVSAGTGSYTDTSATAGTTYYYTAKAADGTNESTASNEASAASARNLPLPPINVTAVDTPYDLGGSIILTWTKSTDDGANLNNVSGYNIYKSSSADPSKVLLGTVAAGNTGYVDTTTLDGLTYYYSINAFNSHCNMESPASNTASGQSVNNFTALPGFISTLPGISSQLLNSLTSKVENAIASFESGNTTAAVNKLNALLNEISAQSGKGIEPSTAQILTTYVQNLIAYINAH